MNTKEEVLSHLKEMLKMESEAFRMYSELASQTNSTALKNFFLSIAEEEQGHAKIVGDLITICEKD